MTNYPFPADDDQDIGSASDERLRHLYDTAPHLHAYGTATIARISRSLAVKGGAGLPFSESQNMIFARDVLHLPVPKVHRTFTAAILYAGDTVRGHFIVMDYISRPAAETWGSHSIQNLNCQ